MNNICIGIISYLPDDGEIREVRAKRVENLIKQCDNRFKLPIIIIAQNWKDFRVETSNSQVLLYNYQQRLGITNARTSLRDKFLKSDYDYILMIDDDMTLSESGLTYQKWNNFIANLDKECYINSGFLINFMLISKEGFNKVTFNPDISAEHYTGYEDVIFCDTVRKYLRWAEMPLQLSDYTRQAFLNDKFSTWDTHDKNKERLNQAATRAAKQNI